MKEALALQPLADTGGREKVDGTLFEHAATNRLLDLDACAALENHRLDSRKMQKM